MHTGRLFKNKVKQIAMKAGDKIVTDEGVELIAEHKEPGYICKGCYFYNDGECMTILYDCLDEYGKPLIFKKVES